METLSLISCFKIAGGKDTDSKKPPPPSIPPPKITHTGGGEFRVSQDIPVGNVTVTPYIDTKPLGGDKPVSGGGVAVSVPWG